LAKKVDGVYSADPSVDRSAMRFDQLTYIDILQKGLKAMDSTAISLCMDNAIPIKVFDLDNAENIKRVICGEQMGTYIHS